MSCWPKHSAEEQDRAPFQHHLLKSSSYHGGKNDKTTFSHNHTDYDVDTVNSGDRSNDDFIELQLWDDDYCSGNDYDPQGQQSTAVSKVQIKLNNLINNHKALLKLYDDIVDLFNDYVSFPNFDKNARLKRRKLFIQSMERMYCVTHLQPKHHNVILHDDAEVTVPIFDAKSMILNLLTNPFSMDKANIAEGYDVFTCYVDGTHMANKQYGEIHSGDDWLPVGDRFCTRNDDTHNDMPIGLIIFGDKSHTNLHGSLALMPIIFTLTFFNRISQNNTHFWRPLAYIPNLGYGKNKANKTNTRDKIQDEHTCLSTAIKSLREIHRNGEFQATVMGREVNIKVWIHFFIRDNKGNNKWLGHYPGNRKQIC